MAKIKFCDRINPKAVNSSDNLNFKENYEGAVKLLFAYIYILLAPPSTGGLARIGEEGYRTYSFIKNIAPGEWRVNVETADHKIIGRLRFNVTQVDTEPALKTEVLD